MATPESNALLARELFRPASEIIINANQQRAAVVARLAELAAQQNFAREREASQQGFQRERDAGQFQNARTLAADAESRALNVERERGKNQLELEAARDESRDLRDLQQKFAVTYPAYTKVAAVAGITPKPLGDFEQSWEGLGELSAELGMATDKAAKKENTAAAMPIIGAARMALTQVQTAIALRNEASAIRAEDVEAARAAGLAAIQEAVTMGALEGIKPKALAAGIAALSNETPDVEIATKAFGQAAPAVMSLYERARQQEMLRRENAPERRAELQSLSRNVDTAMRGASDVLGRLATAAAKNPEIGASYPAFEKEMLELNTRTSPPPPPDTNAIFRQMIGPPSTPPAESQLRAPLSTPAAGRAPSAPNLFNLSGVARSNTVQNTAVQPAPVLQSLTPQAPGAAAAAVNPPSLMTRLLPGANWQRPTGIGVIDTGIRTGINPAPNAQIDVEAVLSQRPGGPWTPDEQKAILAKRQQNQQNAPSTLQRLFPGARF